MNSRGLRHLWRTPHLLAVLLAGFLLAGCPSNEPELAQPPQSETTPDAAAETPQEGLLSSVHMGDPAATPQLLEGFYGIEQGVWRWTGRTFAVALQRPPGAGTDTQLEFKFTLPEAVIGRIKTTTLTARVNGTAIGSQTYTQAGDQVFEKPIPAAALEGDGAVKVEFELDKALPPGEADKRELGLVAIAVALK